MQPLGISVHMPIISPYGVIKFDVYQKVHSWMHKNPVDELISNDEVEMQEIYKCINTGHQLQYVHIWYDIDVFHSQACERQRSTTDDVDNEVARRKLSRILLCY
jgi:hypothetical protein